MFSRRSCKLRLCNSAIESLNNQEKERKRERGGERVRERERKRNVLTFLAQEQILSDRDCRSSRRKVAAVCRYRFVNRADYPPLILRSSFLARAFRFETAITTARTSERAYQIHHLSTNVRGSLSQFRREKRRRGSGKKGKVRAGARGKRTTECPRRRLG